MKVMIAGFAIALVVSCGFLAAEDDALAANDTALRAAVDGKKGVPEIKRLAVLVLTEAKKQMGPAPAGEDKDNWEAHSKYAASLAEYAEYALYSASVGAPAATAIDLISTLETQAPKSKYLTQDAYLAVANAAMGAQQADRASAFARKSLTAAKGAKPEQATAQAHYIVGVVAASKNDFAGADKELKAALPGIKGNAELEGPALFYLGEADYSLGRQASNRGEYDEGIQYELQSSRIASQYKQRAASEALRMKAEVGEK